MSNTTYTNPALKELTQQYPVAETMGQFYDHWKTGDLTGMEAGSFFASSPAQNFMTEMNLGRMLWASVAEDGWSGLETDLKASDVKMLKNATSDNDAPSEDNPWVNHPWTRAARNGLITLEYDGEKVYMAPGPEFPQFVAGRVERYSRSAPRRTTVTESTVEVNETAPESTEKEGFWKSLFSYLTNRS